MGLLSLAACLAALAQTLPREEWGAMPVTVSHADGQWRIVGKKQTLVIEDSDLSLRVEAGPAHWTMVSSGANDMRVRSSAGDATLRLADALEKSIVPYDAAFKTGVKIELSGWFDPDPRKRAAPIDLTLFLTVCLEGKDEDLVFDIAADERHASVRQLNWPTVLDSREIDHTILSNIRGVLLPRDWPKPYHPIRSSNPDGSIKESDHSELQSHVIEDWSMSWWGFQKGDSAMMIIVETPDDAAYQFEHPAGGPTVIGPRWRASLGKLADVRTARMCFMSDGNYVDMAKRYRRYAKETGLFVSLDEKIARNPIVKELIGTPLMRAGILRNYHPDGARYKRTDPEDRYSLTTFDERADFLRDLKFNGPPHRRSHRLAAIGLRPPAP